MCKRYGVDVPTPVSMGDVEQGPTAAEITTATRADLLHCFEQAQLGFVGTRIFAGRIATDSQTNYTPTVVRGTSGNAGLYEQYYDSESMIYDSVVGVGELVASAAPKLVMPKRIRRSQLAQVEALVAAQNAALESFKCMEGGFRKFATEAATGFAKTGFATFERIHRQTPAGWVLAAAQPRIQSSVNRWIMSQDGDDLVGVEYRSSTGYSDKNVYILPAVGPTAHDVRVLLFRIGSSGIDWEGTPPTRPSLHWVKFKRLIAQLIPAAAEKYGVPISYIRRDPAFMSLLSEGGISGAMPDMDDAYNAFLDSLAEDVPVHKFGDGIIVETIAPPGQMPTLDTWIQYCDQMIAYPFSNEGNLMGLQSSAGSYSQAEVRERRFLRSAPYYQSAFTEPLNEQCFKPLFREACGELLEYPRLELSASRMSDNSQWMVDARSLFGPNLPVEEWPAEFRAMAYEKMGIATSQPVIINDEVEE